MKIKLMLLAAIALAMVQGGVTAIAQQGTQPNSQAPGSQ